MRHGWLVILAVGAVACGNKKNDEPSAVDKAVEDFAGYAKQGKRSEAELGIRKIYEGARTYYMEENASRSGQVMPRQFPASAPMTPPAGECCKHGGKCAPSPGLWDSPAWQALYFSMDDPHYYSYEFISEGTDETAAFTVRAVGDLDCDGVFSTFEMYGKPLEDRTVPGPGGVYKENEGE